MKKIKVKNQSELEDKVMFACCMLSMVCLIVGAFGLLLSPINSTIGTVFKWVYVAGYPLASLIVLPDMIIETFTEEIKKD